MHRHAFVGDDGLFGRLWAQTGCRDVLASLPADRRFGFDLERAVYVTVLHRLIISGSDRHAPDWKGKFRIPGAAEPTLDQSYTVMAWLEEVSPGAAGPLGPRTMTDVIEGAGVRAQGAGSARPVRRMIGRRWPGPLWPRR